MSQPHLPHGSSPLQIKSKSVFGSAAAAKASSSASNVTPLKKPTAGDDMPVDVVIGGSFASLVGGSSLCPHLLDEYFKRVRDIFEVYKSQIVQFVKYGALRESLLERGMLQPEEDGKICEQEDETGKMTVLLKILTKRMWGLENLITVLIEVNVDSWLVEEMFHKYVFYIVNEIKRLKNGAVCSCFSKDQKSLLGSTIDKFFETCDSWLYSIGTSLGFLTLTIHGSTSALQPISDLLPVNRGKAGQKSFSRVEMSRANIATCKPAKSEKSVTEALGAELLTSQPSSTVTKPSDRLTTKDGHSHKDACNQDSNNSHDLIETRDKQHDKDTTCETPQEPNGSLGKPDVDQEGRKANAENRQPSKKTHNNSSRLKDYRKRLKVKIPKMDVVANDSSLSIYDLDETPQEINVMVLPANNDLDSSQPSPAKAAVRSWFTLHSFSNGSLNSFSIDSQPPSSSSAGSSSSFNFTISGHVPDTIRSMIQDRRLSQPMFKDTPGHRDKCVSVPALPALMCPSEVADSQVPATSPTTEPTEVITALEENPKEVVVEVEEEMPIEPVVMDVEESHIVDPAVEIAHEETSSVPSAETPAQVVEEMDIPPLVTTEMSDTTTTTNASTTALPPIPTEAPQIIEVEPTATVSEKTADNPTTELTSVPVPITPAGPVKKSNLHPVVELPKLAAPASVSIRRSLRPQPKTKESNGTNKPNKLPVVAPTPRNKPLRSMPVTTKPITPAGSFETFGFGGERLKARKDINISLMSSRSNTENSFSRIPGFRGRAVSNGPNVVPNLPQRTPSRIALQNANRPFLLNTPRTEPAKLKVAPRTSLQKERNSNSTNEKIGLKSDAEMNQANKRKDAVTTKVEKPAARVSTVGSILSSTNPVPTPSRKSSEVKIVQKAAVKPRIQTQTNSKLDERRKVAAPTVQKSKLQEKPIKKTDKPQRKKSTSELILSNSVASLKSKPLDVLSKVVQSYVLHGREKTLSLPNILLLTTSNGTLRSCHFVNVKLRRYKSLVFHPAVKKLSCSVKPVQSRVNRKSIAHVPSSQVAQSSSNNSSVSLFAIPADPRARKLVHAASQTEVSMRNDKQVLRPTKLNPTRRLPVASHTATKSGALTKGTNPPKPKTLAAAAPPSSSASSKQPPRSSKPPAAPAPAKPSVTSKRPPAVSSKTPGPVPERFSQFSVDTYNFQQWSNQWIAKKTPATRLPTKK